MTGLIDKWKKPVEDAKEVFTLLQGVPWDDPFVQRDAIDIARMVLDRAIAVRVWAFGRKLAKWRGGELNGAEESLARARNIAALCDAMADLLALHTDYSLWESYQRLDAVEKIRNPAFEKTLFENSSCGYCRSHQYELARYWYAPHVKAVVEKLAEAVAVGKRKATVTVNAEQERLALKAKPLESLRPTLPRTEENFRKVLGEVASLLN
jgi:thiol-disulfide isomerase/thioredoxin